MLFCLLGKYTASNHEAWTWLLMRNSTVWGFVFCASLHSAVSLSFSDSFEYLLRWVNHSENCVSCIHEYVVVVRIAHKSLVSFACWRHSTVRVKEKNNGIFLERKGCIIWMGVLLLCTKGNWLASILQNHLLFQCIIRLPLHDGGIYSGACYYFRSWNCILAVQFSTKWRSWNVLVT